MSDQALVVVVLVLLVLAGVGLATTRPLSDWLHQRWRRKFNRELKERSRGDREEQP